MASAVLFHYLPLDSPIHRIDPRCKLASLLLLSIGVTFARHWWQFAAVFMVIVVGYALARLPLRLLMHRARPFFVLCLLVILLDLFLIPGEPLPGIALPGASLAGLEIGLLFVAKILLVVALCVLFMETTTIGAFRHTIEWVLRPIPFLNEPRIATMLSLTLRMVPLLFDSYSEIADAQRARCIELRRNPFTRLLPTVKIFLITALRRVDEIVYAMESRCYSDQRTHPLFVARPTDFAALALCVTVFVSCLVSSLC